MARARTASKKTRLILALVSVIVVASFLFWIVFPVPPYALDYVQFNAYASSRLEIHIDPKGRVATRKIKVRNGPETVGAGRLSKRDMRELGRFVMKENRFFMLHGGKLDSGRTEDDSTEALSVTWGMLRFKAQGYAVRHASFRNIADRLMQIADRIDTGG